MKTLNRVGLTLAVFTMPIFAQEIESSDSQSADPLHGVGTADSEREDHQAVDYEGLVRRAMDEQAIKKKYEDQTGKFFEQKMSFEFPHDTLMDDQLIQDGKKVSKVDKSRPYCYAATSVTVPVAGEEMVILASIRVAGGSKGDIKPFMTQGGRGAVDFSGGISMQIDNTLLQLNCFSGHGDIPDPAELALALRGLINIKLK